MKSLVLILISFIFYSNSVSDTEYNDPPTKENKVVVSLNYGENKEVILKMTPDMFIEFDVLKKLDCLEAPGTCTYKFSDGSCKKVGKTCQDAKKKFSACACESGHEKFCPKK